MGGNSTGARRLRVLGVQDREFADYNGPRASAHAIERRRVFPLERIHRSLGVGAAINPWPPKGLDLVHAWKRVPFGPTPFVLGFEWHLPLSWEHQPRSFNAVMDRLLSPQCRKVVAISKRAAAATLHRHEKHPGVETLRAKMAVRPPNISIPDIQDTFDATAKLDELRLLFVGDHFARKGGCVAVRLAEKARAAGLPLHITIVSALQCGGGIWTDPQRREFFDPYLKLLAQPNVTVLPPQSRASTMELIGRSHLTLLPTLADRFDYTVAEGMARFTPAIVTASSSFPEFLDGGNGVLLSLDVGCQGDWRGVERTDRGAPAFEAMFADTVDELADQALAACRDLLDDPARLGAMRQAARRTAEEKFDAAEASRFWDRLYSEAVERR
jgi:glycosyltransferase involved in cell wall biosynthesis